VSLRQIGVVKRIGDLADLRQCDVEGAPIPPEKSSTPQAMLSRHDSGCANSQPIGASASRPGTLNVEQLALSRVHN